ncbi:MAG: hypothetical protein U5N58_00295 [Actinomycetota bacterium]|nr:hypothetical protein [Actinomycetota bacterium]
MNLLEDDATSLKSLGKDRVFDKIFVDAPCSAFRTISKNPDAKYGRNYQDLERLGEKSYQILKCAKDYLRQKGQLIFYTCTLSPVENQQVVKRFLKSFPDFSSEQKISTQLKTKTNNGSMEIMPYYYDSEGGFACCMIKG